MSGESGLVPLTDDEQQAAERVIAEYFEAKIHEAEEVAVQAAANVRAAKATATAWGTTRTLCGVEAFGVVAIASTRLIEAGEALIAGGGSKGDYERRRDDQRLVFRYVREVLGHDMEGHQS
ncbi:hypothetical protein [Streptosporangium sp. NPDC002721]|uniref:hypothetical protein n=1 Tax=Streptosporangium sp. NPDC002721 TaxID=3366188 RepID=UPI0036C95DC7